MLKINMEYRKGILFIRLKGELTRFNYQSLNDYLIPLIDENGIRFIVMNLSYLSLIDNYGKDSIRTIISETKKNNGKGLICKPKVSFDDTMRIIDNELSALNILKV